MEYLLAHIENEVKKNPLTYKEKTKLEFLINIEIFYCSGGQSYNTF